VKLLADESRSRPFFVIVFRKEGSTAAEKDRGKAVYDKL